VPLVLTQPDRPAGRGLKLQPSPVKVLAQRHGLALAQPQGLKLDGRYAADAQAARAALQAARPDVLVVAAYGLILPAWALALPRLGCVNIHASLLPRWRGAAPIQRAIEAGDASTGVTIMQMDAGLDTGDMLLVQSVPIAADDTSATLHDTLATVGARLVVEALRAAEQGKLARMPQPSAGVTYAHKIDKTESRIDWRQPAAPIERRLRAFDPQPGCHFDFEGEALKVWRGRVVNALAAEPGTLLRDGPRATVACGEGALELLEVQRPGGKRLPVAASTPPGLIQVPVARADTPPIMSHRRLSLSMLLALASLLAACDFGGESAEAVAARKEAEGKAVGGACRHAGRAIEDCFALNKRADKAAVFAGWREMNDYMRDNKVETVTPQGVTVPTAGDTAPAVKPDKPKSKATES
jgi:methionyl-tRNA formyltransferase